MGARFYKGPAIYRVPDKRRCRNFGGCLRHAEPGGRIIKAEKGAVIPWPTQIAGPEMSRRVAVARSGMRIHGLRDRWLPVDREDDACARQGCGAVPLRPAGM